MEGESLQEDKVPQENQQDEEVKENQEEQKGEVKSQNEEENAETPEQPEEEEKKDFELEKVKIKNKERLSARARNNPVNTSNMSATKAAPSRNATQNSGAQGGTVVQDDSVKKQVTKKKSQPLNESLLDTEIDQVTKAKQTLDPSVSADGPAEEGDQTSANGKRPMNKAEIYQAVRRAKLRSNYMNRDIVQNVNDIRLSKDPNTRKEMAKFHPYFQEITKPESVSNLSQSMQGKRTNGGTTTGNVSQKTSPRDPLASARSRVSNIAKKNPKLAHKLAEKNKKIAIQNANAAKRMKSQSQNQQAQGGQGQGSSSPAAGVSGSRKKIEIERVDPGSTAKEGQMKSHLESISKPKFYIKKQLAALDPQPYDFKPNAKQAKIAGTQSLMEIKMHGQPQSILAGTISHGIKVDQKFGDLLPKNMGSSHMSGATSTLTLPYKGMHVQDNGPGQYDLPPLVGSGSLSTFRNSSRVSIGLPNTKGSPYHRENAGQFLGKHTPSVTAYYPEALNTKEKQPSFSVSRFKRFYKPSSISTIQAQVPTQYVGVDNSINKSQRSKVLNDMMGAGKKFSYKISKEEEQNPGPGMYSNIEPDSIQMKTSRSNKNGIGFGSGKEQYDKLQYHGQERHFLGRYGAGPGHYSTKGGLEPKKLSIPMSDRGLLPLNDEQQRSKLRLYNNSHLHLGPGQYNSSIEVHNATTLKKSKGYAKQTSPRLIDHSKWGSQHQVLIEKGL